MTPQTRIQHGGNSSSCVELASPIPLLILSNKQADSSFILSTIITHDPGTEVQGEISWCLSFIFAVFIDFLFSLNIYESLKKKKNASLLQLPHQEEIWLEF